MISNYINKLLNIEDIFIENIIQKDNSVEIFISTKAKIHSCPSCGSETKRIHDYRKQKIKDLPFQLKACYLVLKNADISALVAKDFLKPIHFFQNISSGQDGLRRLSQMN